MLLVKAEARRSPIHGLGLFAVEPIKKGTPVARWTEGHDMRMTPAEWATLPPRVREFLHIWWWTRDDGNWYGTCDDGRFANHSTTPNMLWDDAAKFSFACRDIEAGEELTEDYSDFDACFADYAAELGAAPGEPTPPEPTNDDDAFRAEVRQHLEAAYYSRDLGKATDELIKVFGRELGDLRQQISDLLGGDPSKWICTDHGLEYASAGQLRSHRIAEHGTSRAPRAGAGTPKGEP